MRPQFPRTKDFWAGLFLIAFGSATVLIALNYPMGTSLRMGAGYFPALLGMILIVFGVILAARSHNSRDLIEANWSLRAFIVIPLAVAAFGLLIDRAGFVVALFSLIVASAAAGPEFRLIEALIIGAVLTAACALVFVVGLGLPYRLFAW